MGMEQTFSTFLGSERRTGRRSLTVAASVLMHAGVLGLALVWGLWRIDEIQPRRELPITLWHRPPAPAATAGTQRQPERQPRRQRRTPRPAIVPPDHQRPQQPVTASQQTPATAPSSAKESDGPGGESDGLHGCPPGQICTGAAPPPALPPEIGEKACVSCPPPQLPPAYRRAGVSLQALVKICVDAQGRVRSANVLKGISATVDAQIASTIQGWRYKPHAINGNPVPFCYATLFTFKVL